MKRIFILEDNKWRIQAFKNKFPDSELIIKQTASEAIELLSKDLNFDILFLDHDLGNQIFMNSEEENTGYQVAKFLQDKEIKGEIIIHSMNYVGAKNIMSLLPKATYKPFIVLFNNPNQNDKT